MVKDFENSVGEDDLTHVDEILACRADQLAEPEENAGRVLLDNFKHRMIHHHVFNTENSRQLLEWVGLDVLAVETYPPFHIFLIARSKAGLS